MFRSLASQIKFLLALFVVGSVLGGGVLAWGVFQSHSLNTVWPLLTMTALRQSPISLREGTVYFRFLKDGDLFRVTIQDALAFCEPSVLVAEIPEAVIRVSMNWDVALRVSGLTVFAHESDQGVSLGRAQGANCFQPRSAGARAASISGWIADSVQLSLPFPLVKADLERASLKIDTYPSVDVNAKVAFLRNRLVKARVVIQTQDDQIVGSVDYRSEADFWDCTLSGRIRAFEGAYTLIPGVDALLDRVAMVRVTLRAKIRPNQGEMTLALHSASVFDSEVSRFVARVGFDQGNVQIASRGLVNRREVGFQARVNGDPTFFDAVDRVEGSGSILFEDQVTRFSGEWLLETDRHRLLFAIHDLPGSWGAFFTSEVEISSVFSATSVLVLDRNGQVTSATITLSAQEGEIVLNEIFTHPVRITEFQGVLMTREVDRLSSFPYLNPEQLQLDYTAILVSEETDPTLIWGAIALSSTEDISIEIDFKDLTIPQVQAFWPLDVAPRSRRWIREGIREGRFSSLSFVLGVVVEDSSLRVKLVSAEFSGEDLTIQYLKRMPLVYGVRASGVYENEVLNIHFEQGYSGRERPLINLAETDLTIEYLDRVPYLTLEGALYGTVVDSVEFLDMLSIKAIGRLSDEMVARQGTYRTTVSLMLPLSNREGSAERHFHINMILEDTVLTLDNHSIRDLSGRVFVNIFKEEARGSLRGVAYGVTSAVQFHTVYSQDRIEADLRIEAVHETGVEFFGSEFVGRVKGQAWLWMNDQETQVDVELDLSDSGWDVPMLSYRKSRPTDAEFITSLRITDEIVALESFILRGEGLFLSVNGKYSLESKRIDLLKIPLLQINDTVFSVSLKDSNKRYTASVSSPEMSVDLIKSLLETAVDPPTGPSEKAEPIAKPKRQTSAPRKSSRPSGRLRPDSKNDFSLAFKIHSLTDPQGDSVLRDFHLVLDYRQSTWYHIQISVKDPDGAEMLKARLAPYQQLDFGVIIEVEDLGYLLRSLGLVDEILNGKTNLKGFVTQRGDEVIFNGDLRIEEYSALELPIFVQLLRLINPISLLELLSTEGLAFDYFETNISVRDRCLNLYDAIAVGPTVRLGIDQGRVDFGSKALDVDGYIGVFEFLNWVSSSFAGILTRFFSSREGWFAVPFKIEGEYDDPSIVIEPVSWLSWVLPGIVRDVFLNFVSVFTGQPVTLDLSC